MKRRLRCGRGPYRTTNSGPAARAWPSLPSRPVRSLSPPPFPLDHPPQGLTAGGTAKRLARAATGECKPLFTARTLAAKKFAFPRWALALAGLGRSRAAGFWCRSQLLLFLGCPAAFRASRSIPVVLSLPFLPPSTGMAIVPAGLPSPPSPSCGPALGTAIAGLRMGGTKELLTSLEQTPSLSRPMSPLTGPGFAASWWWAQGSCELPTAKPRTRSPYLRSEATSWINSALMGVHHSHHKAGSRGFQANQPGTT